MSRFAEVDFDGRVFARAAGPGPSKDEVDARMTEAGTGRQRARGFGALMTLTMMVGCVSGDESIPSGPMVPLDTVSYPEDRGRIITTGVRRATSGLVDPNWVFLGSDAEIAYATGTGLVGEGRVWFRALDANGPRRILDGLNVVQELQYASEEGQIYVGQWPSAVSVGPDGTDPATITDNNQGPIRVSPDGRYVLYTRQSSGQTVLVDRVTQDTRDVDYEPALVRMSDAYAVFPTGLGMSESGVGVWDLATGDTALTSGLQANFGYPAIIDIGGTRDEPRMTVIDATDGAHVVTFVGNTATGHGTTSELLSIPGDSIWADPYDNVKGGASPDGSRIAVSVLRDYLSGCFGSPCRFRWDILLLDAQTGEASVVAYGVSTGEPEGIVFSPDGSRLLYETDGQLYLVDVP